MKQYKISKYFVFLIFLLIIKISFTKKNPSVVGLSDGNFVISWEAIDSSGLFNIFGKIYDSKKNIIKDEFLISTEGGVTNNLTNSGLLSFQNGKFLSTWLDSSNCSFYLIYGKMYYILSSD